jgi:hypothetical protein
MTQAIAKKEAQQQQVQQQKQSAKHVETQEHHSSANASVCPPVSLTLIISYPSYKHQKRQLREEERKLTQIPS